jgi:hypothetical protein
MRIFGQVLDNNDEPMGLANITIVTGANINKLGTQADLDGKFILEDPNIESNSQFRISYIGYRPQYFKTTELQGRKVKLLEDIEALPELILTSGGKPKDNIEKQSNTFKGKFTEHLTKHKFIYAGLGGLAGVLLIVKAFKN